METKITRRVREWIAKEQLLAQGMNVIVGYSGGSDSLCLLLLLRDIAADLSLNLTAVHVNHGIRGAEADRDEAFCRETAERLGVAFRAVSVDIPTLAKERGKGIEETGRTERYRIFAEIAAEISEKFGGATRVAVAHHADDNAETILMHLVRGSGLRGLTGIPADSTPFADKTVHLIRPLLPLTKKDILAELSARGETYCEDATNYEADGDRNILRNRIMPLLAELNPRAGAHIASAGTHLSAAWRFMDEQAKEAFRRVCRDGNPSANSPPRRAPPATCETSSSTWRRFLRCLRRCRAKWRCITWRRSAATARILRTPMLPWCRSLPRARFPPRRRSLTA
ncbi:MAG: tRNA lysidine(34) synthetase TilS [Lachnospiraceae bacterium]|nr:tRNA lysidine(34) synthetase TilS [Lachnospiraceae bacterium]